MRDRPLVIRTLLCLGLMALVATACALPPKKPVVDLGSLAGRWEGPVSNGQSLAWDVARDGSVRWTASGGGSGTGKLSLQDGRLFYESSTGRTSYFDYHEGDGRRGLKTPDVELTAR